MRLDQLPTSGKIEDRRGLPVGRAGLGIGTVIILVLLGWILGIDPRVLIGARRNDFRKQSDAAATGWFRVR